MINLCYLNKEEKITQKQLKKNEINDDDDELTHQQYH